jgi:hypothetical protein
VQTPQRLIIAEEKCDGSKKWPQLWSEAKEVEPLVINGFVDDITPAQRQKVPFVSIFCILTALIKIRKRHNNYHS